MKSGVPGTLRNTKSPSGIGWFKSAALLSGLGAYYAGNASIALWAFSLACIILLIRTIGLSSILISLSLAFLVVLRIAVSPENALNLLVDLRFFWGFFPFFLFFYSENQNSNTIPADYESFFKNFMVIALIAIVLEFISSNTLHIQWPNNFYESFENELEREFIIRVYGFGGSPSVTTVLSVALTSVLYRTILVDILILGMVVSGAGAVAIAIKLLFRLSALRILGFALIGVCFVIWAVPYISEDLGYGHVGKLSVDYFAFIFEYKVNQLNKALAELSGAQIMLGQALRVLEFQAGDFLLLDWFVSNGVVGVLLFSVLVGVNVCRYNALPLFLMIFCTIHYQVFFSMPGSILFAWILAYRGPTEKCEREAKVVNEVLTRPSLSALQTTP